MRSYAGWAVTGCLLMAICVTNGEAGIFRHRRCGTSTCEDPRMPASRGQTVGQIGAHLVQLRSLLAAETLSPAARSAVDAKLLLILGNPAIDGPNTSRRQVEGQ